jgi:hypothetical protein
VPLKTPSKPNGKNIEGESIMAYINTCIYIVSLKTFYEKPKGKTHEGKKSTILYDLMILNGLSHMGVYSP